MKVAGIVAEFNPLHNGHKYIIDYCKKELLADYVVIVMSGDYVQRGAPALISKFSRAKMATEAGADLILELPLYYSTGSAEYFAEGAISVLEGLGVVTDLVFGSEIADTDKLSKVSDILIKEPSCFKEAMKAALASGLSFPAARAKGICAGLKELSGSNEDSSDEYQDIFSSPNSILGVEYIKALKRRNSMITPHAVKRIGASYDFGEILSANDHEDISASALGIRKLIFDGGKRSEATFNELSKETLDVLFFAMPEFAVKDLSAYNGLFLDSNAFSELLRYKLLLEKNKGFSDYLDVGSDLSNRISSCDLDFTDFNSFCDALKTKNLTYTRISRALLHILLNITAGRMEEYKKAGYTSYIRSLAMKKDSSALLSMIHDASSLPVIDRLKDASKLLSPLQKHLFDETLTASQIYNSISKNGIVSEYSLRSLLL